MILNLYISVGVDVGFDGDDIVVAGTFEELGHMVKVHAHGEGTIAAEVLEAIGSEEEGNVARIHGLEGEAEGGAIEIGVNHQIVDVWCRVRGERREGFRVSQPFSLFFFFFFFLR